MVIVAYNINLEICFCPGYGASVLLGLCASSSIESPISQIRSLIFWGNQDKSSDRNHIVHQLSSCCCVLYMKSAVKPNYCRISSCKYGSLSLIMFNESLDWSILWRTLYSSFMCSFLCLAFVCKADVVESSFVNFTCESFMFHEEFTIHTFGVDLKPWQNFDNIDFSQFRSIHTWTGHGSNYIHVGQVSGWSCFFMLMILWLKMEWQLNSICFHGSQSLGKWLVLESLLKCWISYNDFLMTIPLIIYAPDFFFLPFY